MASKIKISDSPAQPKATFLRKSTFLSTGSSSFRFNFDAPNSSVDNENAATTSSAELNSNIKSSDKPNTTETDNQSTKPDTKDNSAVASKDESNSVTSTFKFIPSGSEFKFNFNVDN